MYCVIQKMELKKQNTCGAYKKLEAYKNKWTMNGVDIGGYDYRYTGDRFERPIKKAYKISIHHSYRENGKVKKKQWVICTANYYSIVDGWFYIGESYYLEKSSDMGITEDELYELLSNKVNLLRDKLEEEYHQTEEYKVHSEHKKIIKKHIDNKSEFEKKYGKDTYYYYYDVFGVLREKEKFEAFKRQYEAAQEQKHSYYENFQSNYNSNSNSSYSTTKQSNYTNAQKEYLKKIYRAAAIKLHPDVTKDDGFGMKFLNELKENWGI